MSLIFCDCGNYFDTNKDVDKLTKYKLKNPTIRHTERNERVISEIFLNVYCPRCERTIVFIRRWAINALGKPKVLLPETLTGKEAEEYLEKTKENRINKTIELEYKQEKYCSFIPLRYFKTLSGTTQRARYINEAGYSGEKIETEVKVFS